MDFEKFNDCIDCMTEQLNKILKNKNSNVNKEIDYLGQAKQNKEVYNNIECFSSLAKSFLSNSNKWSKIQQHIGIDGKSKDNIIGDYLWPNNFSFCEFSEKTDLELEKIKSIVKSKADIVLGGFTLPNKVSNNDINHISENDKNEFLKIYKKRDNKYNKSLKDISDKEKENIKDRVKIILGNKLLIFEGILTNLRHFANKHKNLKNDDIDIYKTYINIYSKNNEITDLIKALAKNNSQHKINGAGIPIAAEYLKYLNFKCIKPDRHIMRILSKERLAIGSWSSINSKNKLRESFTEKEYIDAIKIIGDLSNKINKDTNIIDNIMWMFCADEFGEICTAKPKCNKCILMEKKLCYGINKV